MPIAYTTKINQRAIGAELLIVNETHVVGTTAVATTSSGQIRLIEVPLQESPSSVAIPGFTEVTGTPGTNEFKVDYTNGRITFNVSRNGDTVFVTYKGRGSIIDAEDINELQQVFIGSVTPGSATIGIANLDGTLSDGIVRPSNISTIATDSFTFPEDVIITGDLTVNGTTTSVNTETVTIKDNIILLNSTVTGTPTTDGGIEVERGTSPNVQLVWNETDDAWEMKNTSGSAILEAFDTGDVYINGALAFGGNLKPHTNSTTAITLSDASGTPVFTVDSTNRRVGINTTPLATLHNNGSTIFGLTTATNPASITTAQVDANSGIVITSTTGVVVTIGTPTNTTMGRFFTVLHSETSTGTLSVNSQSVGIGKGATFLWDGLAWIPVGGAGSFNLTAGDPGSPQTGDTWFDTTTSQFKGYNGTNTVILG